MILMLNKVLRSCSHFTTVRKTVSHNHYQILGVTKDADMTEIKKKFYELAKIYHPDVSSEQEAAVKFSRISIAYEILSDNQKRKTYDQENSFYYKNNNDNYKDPKQGFKYRYQSTKQHAPRSQQDFQPYNQYDSYFKKNRKFWKPKRGADININFSITFEDSIKGVKKQVHYTQQQICSNCSDQEHPVCFTCGGKGNIFNRNKRQKQKCSNCSGKGYKNDCVTCNGQSYTQKQVKYMIYFEKNTHNRSILRIQGLGGHGYKALNGDLYVTVFVEPSDIFKIDGNNVSSDHQVDYLVAIFGGKTKVKTVFGMEQITIQPGSQSGKQIRLFNKGLTSPFSKRKGDHIITLKIKIPDELSQKQKILLKQLMTEKKDI